MHPQAYIVPPPPTGCGDYEPRRFTPVPTKRQKLIAAGKCVNYFRCHRERGEEGTATMCRPCADQKNQQDAPRLTRRRRRKARRGLCIERTCRAPARRGKTRCAEHLILAAQAAQRHRDKMKNAAAGCAEDALH
jgi:hypothetical protein